MANNAAIDQNSTHSLLGVSSVDLVSPTTVAVNPVTHRVLVDVGSISGTITSINGDTTAAQLISGGTGISVATVGGNTTITNTSGLIIGNTVTGGTPKEVLYVSNTGVLTGDVQFERDSVTHETHIQRTQSVNLLAEKSLGSFLIPGAGVTIVGALSTITDQVSGDSGFSGAADLSTFGYTNEATVMGHVQANGDVMTLVIDDLAGIPVAQFNAATATQSATSTFTNAGLDVTGNNNGTNFNVSDITQKYTLNKLGGGGTQMVTADNSGILGVQAIPTGTVTSVSVVTANGVSGSVANPTTTPAITLTLGVITPTTVNGLTITPNGTNTLNITAGKTFTSLHTLTLDGTDGVTVTLPTTNATMARTDAAQTFTGNQTFGTIVTSGNIELGNATDTTLARVSAGVVSIEGNNIATNTSSPTFNTITTTGNIELGNASDTTLSRVSAGVIAVEGVTIATASNTLTFTGKSIVASQITTGTFGTGSYTMDTSLAVPQVFNAESAQTASANAATVTRANRINKVTNNSAAGITITLSTTGATAGDMLIVKSVPSSAVAQTITWVNTENSDVTPSANLNASTTSPRTDGFMWNSLTSKWRCVASC